MIGLLKGDAASSLTGLQLITANYPEAVQILKRRYGQKQVIINSHMDALMKLPVCSESNNISALRNLYDSIEANVRGLQSLGMDSEQYRALLIPVLQQKLPPDLQIEISRKIKNGEWNLSKLLEILKEELEARERCKNLGTTVNIAPQNTKKAYQELMPTAASLLKDATPRTANWFIAHFVKKKIIRMSASSSQIVQQE